MTNDVTNTRRAFLGATALGMVGVLAGTSQLPGEMVPPGNGIRIANPLPDTGIEGIGEVKPEREFFETHVICPSRAARVKNAIVELTGCWNQERFRGYEAGEVLFMGGTGTQTGDGLWSMRFRFWRNRNVVNGSVGLIRGINALGWDLVWVKYGDFRNHHTFEMTKQPIAVYVEKLYNPGDFSRFGIGA